MAIDFEARLLAPAQRVFGQSVTFKSPYDGSAKTLVVIDDTSQLSVGSIAQVETHRPAFRARSSDLAAMGLAAADMINVAVTYRAKSYKIRNPIENPIDGAPGEILFLLAEA
jgi:hypothetical protein